MRERFFLSLFFSVSLFLFHSPTLQAKQQNKSCNHKNETEGHSDAKTGVATFGCAQLAALLTADASAEICFASAQHCKGMFNFLGEFLLCTRLICIEERNNELTLTTR